MSHRLSGKVCIITGTGGSTDPRSSAWPIRCNYISANWQATAGEDGLKRFSEMEQGGSASITFTYSG